MKEQYFFHNKDIKLEKLEDKIQRKIVAHGGKMMIAEVHFKEGAVGSLHKHFHEQVTYCVKGKLEFYVEGEKTIIEAGDSIYMPPNSMHGCKVLQDDTVLLDIFTPQREDFLNKSNK
ncbi:cupin domain-containing protein [Clostridium sp. cel8]|jgi:quercetin dioxygenase-like cupin family protein|uniref:cupin domain-containing protein n=1 Tax=unclassified Clostridium TaxID=2614128 RepID=UPI0015F5022E|nr:cupin domain-containing protein [Clostridium sp. cel8]MBA5850789.1 cupin domain-containing protein [Clostridium sp. cel8]